MPTVNVTARNDSESRDLQVDFVDEQQASLLYETIGPRFGLADGEFGLVLERSGRSIHADAPLGDYALQHADVISVTGSPLEGEYSPARWELVDSRTGDAFPIDRPTVDIGRKVQPHDVELTGAGVSRVHARIDASGDSLVIIDLESSNGTFVNDERITEATELPNGTEVTLGARTLVVRERFHIDPLPSHLTYDGGTLRFNRPPRVQHPAPLEEFEIEEPPAEPKKGKLPLRMSVMPAILGVSMFVMTGRAYSLIFAVGTPIMAFATYLSDRRSGRTGYRTLRTKYLETLERLEATIERARTAATEWRRSRWPNADMTLSRAGSSDAGLWHRAATHDDFLEARVGLADQPSLVTVRTGWAYEGELAERIESLRSITTDPQVPIVVGLKDAGALGVAGEESEIESTARWVLGQLATHHSPRELAVAVLAPDRAEAWDWAKWLPHTHTLDPERPTVAIDDASVARLFEMLQAVASKRSDADDTVVTGSRSHYLPHIVAIVQPPVRLEAAEVASLLDQAAETGITLIWLAAEAAVLPSASSVVLEPGRGRVTFAQSGQTFDGFEVEGLGLSEAESMARALAPLRDATTTSAAAEIPTAVGFFDLIDPVPATADTVIERWQTSPASLEAVLGAGAGSTVSIDMIGDGPHALVGGTTGAGKSELLQTLVASLAVTYPPSRVNFVLIDYKGGAAFKDCVDLPHTVGFVTDLDGRLAERAITSLNAELRWREHVLADAGCKDLIEMRSRTPEVAPPNLILIVDEFAALKTELPEFVDGVVDIARRGRSLGVHLILATQKPRGIISGDIQANTNLRISLRVTDATESSDIIDRPDAAEISRKLPGRAYVKTGTDEVTQVQVAYVGGSAATNEQPLGGAHTFRLTPALLERVRSGSDSTEETQLSAMVTASVEAAARLQLPEPRKPWLPELPDLVTFDMLIDHPAVAPDLAFGLIDDPDSQEQGPAVLPLADAGHVLIYGAQGSGKTTALRTIAGALSMTPRPMHCYAIDFGGRVLSALNDLPRCGDVIVDDELERIRRLMSMLQMTIERRRHAMAASGAASIREHETISGEYLIPIVVLVDRIDRLWGLLEDTDRGALGDEFTSLLGASPSAGIYVIGTVDRPQSLPHRAAGLFPTRIVLPLATEDEYRTLGIHAAGTGGLPGRALLDGRDIQIAVLEETGDPSGAAQTQTLKVLADAVADWPLQPPPSVDLLPDLTPIESLPGEDASPTLIPIGLESTEHDAAILDLSKTHHIVVAGPPGSGRSTTLGTLTRVVAHLDPGRECYLISTRRNESLTGLPWTGSGIGQEEATGLLEGLTVPTGRARLIVVDDADEFADGAAASSLEALVLGARDSNTIIAVSLVTHRVARLFAAWVREVRAARTGILLQPDPAVDGEVLHARLPRQMGLAMPPGRGYLVQGDRIQLVQVAS